MSIKSWSYSRLADYEQCPYRAKLKHVDRIPEEKSTAADRGTMIHTLAEDYVNGKITELPQELHKFKDEFTALRAQFLTGNVSLEGEWGVDRDWNPVPYREAYGRVKIDALIMKDKDYAVVVDYKTGKRFGNELKHGEQVQLYSIAAVLRNEAIKVVKSELWYLDVDDIHGQEYTRAQALKYLPSFEKRINSMTSATTFPPRPNIFSCKYCPYGPAKGGQCEHGVLPGDTPITIYRRKYG